MRNLISSMRVDKGQNGSKVHDFCFHGDISIDSITKYERKINGLIYDGVDILSLNFYNVDFVDSTAIGYLVKLLQTCERKGIKLVCYNLKNEIKRLFMIANLTNYFKIMTEEQYISMYRYYT